MQVSRLLKLFPSYASGPRGPVLPLIVHVLLPCLPWGMWWMVPLITPCSSSLSWWLLNSWLCFTRAQKFAFGKVVFIGRVLKQKILHFTLFVSFISCDDSIFMPCTYFSSMFSLCFYPCYDLSWRQSVSWRKVNQVVTAMQQELGPTVSTLSSAPCKVISDLPPPCLCTCWAVSLFTYR